MTKKAGKQRIDLLLVERELEVSRERARARILAGEVRVGTTVIDKPGTMVALDADLSLTGGGLRFVSRGGLKLEQALIHFNIDVTGVTAIDVGASTGGFTDCLLQRGAARVFAVDVGYGQLAWKLRSDPRVVVLERANIRTLEASRIPEPPSLAVIDCSFIGLGKVLPPTLRFLTPDAQLVALVKPQFEVGPALLGKNGVVRDADARSEAIARVTDEARALGLEVLGGVDCETIGPMGNVEYLLWARLTDAVDRTQPGDAD